jgi:hypothetical protein
MFIKYFIKYFKHGRGFVHNKKKSMQPFLCAVFYIFFANKNFHAP